MKTKYHLITITNAIFMKSKLENISFFVIGIVYQKLRLQYLVYDLKNVLYVHYYFT